MHERRKPIYSLKHILFINNDNLWSEASYSNLWSILPNTVINININKSQLRLLNNLFPYYLNITNIIDRTDHSY